MEYHVHTPQKEESLQTICTECGEEIFYNAAKDAWETEKEQLDS